MYGEDGKEAKAKEYKHMTFTEAAQLAKNADVRELIMRYITKWVRMLE
jgi:ribonuclease Z